MKNYFTDEDVKNIYKDSLVIDPDDKTVTLTKGHLKALMNLAVQTAIGEPVGHTSILYETNFKLHGQSNLKPYSWDKGPVTTIPLYKVSEISEIDVEENKKIGDNGLKGLVVYNEI